MHLIPYLPFTYNVCGDRFSIAYYLDYKKVGLVTTRHNQFFPARPTEIIGDPYYKWIPLPRITRRSLI